jgi:hypothetical protein
LGNRFIGHWGSTCLSLVRKIIPTQQVIASELVTDWQQGATETLDSWQAGAQQSCLEWMKCPLCMHVPLALQPTGHGKQFTLGFISLDNMRHWAKATEWMLYCRGEGIDQSPGCSSHFFLSQNFAFSIVILGNEKQERGTTTSAQDHTENHHSTLAHLWLLLQVG